MTEISGVDGGGSPPGERETDILDDEEDTDAILPAFVAPSAAGVGWLSADETHPGLPGLVRMSESPSPRDLERQRVLHAPLDYSKYIPEARDAVLNGGHGRDHETAPSVRSPPYTPPRGISSREAVLRVAVGDTSSLSELSQEEELSLATDMEESIEQLNQLILDLDPTFIPVPTHSAPLSRSASLHSNGLSPGGQGHKAGEIRPYCDRTLCVGLQGKE